MRAVANSSFRRRRGAASVESLEAQIGGLVAERQSLRERAAGAAVLERNRLRLARAQWELSHALIARYMPAQQNAA
jgi:hypothetical protein